MKKEVLKRILAIALIIIIVSVIIFFYISKEKPSYSPSRSDWFEFSLSWEYQEDSALDLSEFIEAPAGEHGFLGVDGEEFEFEDGTQTRFFGVTIRADRTAFPSHEQAETIAKRLRQLGVNIVMFEAIDSTAVHTLGADSGMPAGLIDPFKDHTQDFYPENLERFDYFISKLKENGIYFMFYNMGCIEREFKTGDGVEHHNGGRQVCFFNERYKQLQKDFINQLLNHVNPYTETAYKDEPALAIVGLGNEFSMFRRKEQRKAITSMPEIYKQELKVLWNSWLKEKYETMASLDSTWTNEVGEKALQLGEDFNDPSNYIDFPYLEDYISEWDRDYTSLKSSARVNDFELFSYALQENFAKEMTSYLRNDIGIEIPILGTQEKLHDAGFKLNTISEFELTDKHYFYDECAGIGGGECVYDNNFVFEEEPFTTKTPPAYMALQKTAGKMNIFSQLGAAWPNEYRSSILFVSSSYASLQNIPLLTIYNYAGSRDLSWDDIKEMGEMNQWSLIYVHDPARVGLLPALSISHMREDISEAENTIEIGFSETDTFYMYSDFKRNKDTYSVYKWLPYISKVQRRFFDTVYPDTKADIVISSGKSTQGDYSNAEHAIIIADNIHADLYDKSSGKEKLTQTLYPNLQYGPASTKTWSLGNFYPDGKGQSLDLGVYVKGIKKSSIPIGTDMIGDSESQYTLGFIDNSHAVVPSAPAVNYKYQTEYSDFISLLFTKAARKWGILRSDEGFNYNEKTLVSDTKELELDYGEGIFKINTEKTQGASGYLDKEIINLDNLKIECDTDFANIIVNSLDNKPILNSRHLLVTTVGRAENTGQVKEPYDGQWKMSKTLRGTEPIIVEPIEGTLTIDNDNLGKNIEIYPLNNDGTRKAKINVNEQSGKFNFIIGGDETIWYEILITEGITPERAQDLDCEKDGDCSFEEKCFNNKCIEKEEPKDFLTYIKRYIQDFTKDEDKMVNIIIIFIGISAAIVFILLWIILKKRN